MSGDAHTGMCTKTAQDTGLPTGYVPSSQCDGVFYSVYGLPKEHYKLFGSPGSWTMYIGRTLIT